MKTGGSEEAMKGIVLLSHGNLAEGLLQASAIFFGEQPQIQALGYQMTEDCDEFAEKIFQKQRVWRTSVNVFKGETMRLFSQPLVKKLQSENFSSARRAAGISP